MGASEKDKAALQSGLDNQQQRRVGIGSPYLPPQSNHFGELGLGQLLAGPVAGQVPQPGRVVYKILELVVVRELDVKRVPGENLL
jgi:hypothetical protein